MFISFCAKIKEKDQHYSELDLDHIVICGYSQARYRITNNKAGAQIRIDGKSKKNEHGVNEHGIVTGVKYLARMTTYSENFEDERGVKWHQFTEASESLKVVCKFNNEWYGKARVHFKIMDA